MSPGSADLVAKDEFIDGEAELLPKLASATLLTMPRAESNSGKPGNNIVDAATSHSLRLEPPLVTFFKPLVEGGAS